MTVSQNGLSGSTVEIRVTINVDQSNEQIRIDDISVTGKRYKKPFVLELQLLLVVHLLPLGLVLEHLPLAMNGHQQLVYQLLIFLIQMQIPQ